MREVGPDVAAHVFVLNHVLAAQFREAAHLLRDLGANPFRVNAWFRAAHTLEDLDTSVAAIAIREGREGLVALRGIGQGIASAILEYLSTGRWSLLEELREKAQPRLPTVPLLLDIDAEYRERATAGTLPVIAPTRFNPDHVRWLPVLHAVREGWHITAVFSNTERAHELGKTDDWVVVYYYDDADREGQCTVVTEYKGALAGLRVVRGREEESQAYYEENVGHLDPRWREFLN